MVEAIGMIASVISLADLDLRIAQQYLSLITNIKESSQRAGEIESLVRDKRFRLWLIESSEHCSRPDNKFAKNSSNRAPQEEVWSELLMLAKGRIDMLFSSPQRDRGRGSRRKVFTGLERLLRWSRRDDFQQQHILATRLCDAQLLVEAIADESDPNILELRGSLAALIILDDTAQAPGEMASRAESNRNMMETLQAIEQRLCTAFSEQKQRSNVEIVLITGQAPMEQRRTGMISTAEFSTRFLLRNTTIYECPDEEVLDCALWSIWDVFEKSVEMEQSPHLAMSRLNLGVANPYASKLAAALHGRSRGEARFISTICQWVAYSCRPLQVSELFEAARISSLIHDGRELVDTDFEFDHSVVQQIPSLGSQVLEVNKDGTVNFQDEDLRALFLSAEASLLGGMDNGDEMIARTCLAYLQFSDPAAVFRAWAGFQSSFQRQLSSFALKRYATAYWHKHYRRAESSSQNLPVLLHNIIASAFPVTRATRIWGHGFFSRRNDFGLELCVRYGFEISGRNYISMGANACAVGTMNNEPLLFMAAARNPHMVGVLLDGGADVHERDENGVTVLEVATFHGNAAVLSALLSRGIDTNSLGMRRNYRQPRMFEPTTRKNSAFVSRTIGTLCTTEERGSLRNNSAPPLAKKEPRLLPCPFRSLSILLRYESSDVVDDRQWYGSSRSMTASSRQSRTNKHERRRTQPYSHPYKRAVTGSTEPAAAEVPQHYEYRQSDDICVCDAGGGTTDMAILKVVPSDHEDCCETFDSEIDSKRRCREPYGHLSQRAVTGSTEPAAAEVPQHSEYGRSDVIYVSDAGGGTTDTNILKVVPSDREDCCETFDSENDSKWREQSRQELERSQLKERFVSKALCHQCHRFSPAREADTFQKDCIGVTCPLPLVTHGPTFNYAKVGERIDQEESVGKDSLESMAALSMEDANGTPRDPGYFAGGSHAISCDFTRVHSGLNGTVSSCALQEPTFRQASSSHDSFWPSAASATQQLGVNR